ncbi:uncharacterized protein EI90DRAFT_2905404 [Cantharellus anzutake]|uniref:uncharacterized protein n=1 Tax=Cantharellus anzutake TaxID=1750568 RepID=UPI0019053DCE|nr:uncharacterized protein EI90DRAFT_2905404 [Cantharellus anzutake]KAF8341322.1 hypothetical protein EI90DRAFT_2905404 [Cantharellus anzutake]
MNDSEQAKGDVISHVLTRSPISNGASGSLSVLATGDRDSILVPQPFRRKDIYNLKDSGNPITHSKAYEKTQHIHSVASGHQRGGGSMNAAVRNAIQERLDAQSLADLQDVPGSKATRKIFAGLKVYVNGYTKGTTRSEIVKLVDLHGGYNLRTATGATHIITSMALSGTKTQKILTGISVKTKQYVVKPEWLFDSIDAGKRLNEFKYNIIDQSQVQSQLKWGKDPLPGSKD